MNKKLLSNLGLLILRVSMSAALITHGYPKFLKLMDGNMSFPDPLGIGVPASLTLAVFGEFIAPLFVLIGLKTRFAAIPPAIAMGVAVFIMHGADPFSKQEHAFIFLAAFIAISLMGAGKFSIDGIMNRR